MSIRGAHNAEGKLVVVAGDQLYQISRAGVAIPIGSLPGTGRVQIDHNQISLGNQVMAVNGSAGYLWNTVTNAYDRITDPGFPGGKSVRFISGYFVVIEPQGRFAASSAPADGTQWNTLDRFTSEVSPDPGVALGVRGQELLYFSTTSGEFFRATANPQQPFRTTRIDFRTTGAAGPHVVVEADGNIYWLGSDGVWYCLDGYSPRRISKRPQEEAIKGLNWELAFGFRWDTVIYWTFPDGLTWGYDFAEREWHRRESPGLNRWRPNTMTRWDRRWIAGDFQADRLWDCNLEDRYYLEGDSEYIVRRTTGVLSDNQNRLKVNRLGLKMAVGQPLTEPVDFPAQPDPPTIDGSSFVYGFVGEPLSEGWASDRGLWTAFDDGDGPFVFSLVPSNGVPGVTVDADGDEATLDGTPTEAGEFDVAVRTTDPTGLWAEASVLATILDVTEDGWDTGEVSGNAELKRGQRALVLSAEGASNTYGSTRSAKSIAGLCYLSAQVYRSDAGNETAFGIADATVDTTDNTLRLGDTTASVALWTADGNVYTNGSSVGNAGSFAADDFWDVEVAVRVSTRKVWVRQSGGAWVGGGDPAADTSPTATLTGAGALYVVGSIDQAPTVTFPIEVRLATTADDTTGTAPVGFIAANWSP